MPLHRAAALWVAASCGLVAHRATADATAEPATQLACDLAQSIATATPEASVHRSSGTFHHEALPNPVRGCRVVITGSAEDPAFARGLASTLFSAFSDEGWQEMPTYTADGKDGTAFALRKDDVACLFQGAWNGGSDDEPPDPRRQAYTVSVLCTRPAPSQDRQP